MVIFLKFFHKCRKFFWASVVLCLSFCIAPESYVSGASLNHADGGMINQPFETGTGGSRYFRIPAFSVMEDGTYVCAADARWDNMADGGGSDIILSISRDEGKSWTYGFPLHFDDSANSLISYSEVATIMDPELVVKGNTIYLFADVYPTGGMSGQNFPLPGTGYVDINGIKRLVLADDYTNTSTNPLNAETEKYPYYIGDFLDNGYAPILNRENGESTKYFVDGFYYIYEETEAGISELWQKQVDSDTIVKQNIFYRDSIFHVYNTEYLFMARTDNMGKSWKYDILNPQVKRDNDTEFVTSPGNGIVLQDGTIVVSVWERPELPNDRSGFIYSSDGGITWERTGGIGVYSNENHIVELQDKTLRMFYRYALQEEGMISYVDIKNEDGVYVWSQVCQSELKADVACNFSVLSYSKTVAGRQVILISCPSIYPRKGGVIYLCQVETDNSLSLLNKYTVTDGYFEYSAMDELQDGSIALLYENEAGGIAFTKIGIGDIAGGIKFDDELINTTIPKKGTVLKHGQNSYKVIKERSEVSFLNTLNKTAKVTIPATVKINGIKYKVTAVSKGAFKNNRKLTSVVLGSEIRRIEKKAFQNCSRLENIIIKSIKLKSVGKSAFKGIKSTAKIRVPLKKYYFYNKLLQGRGQGSKVKLVKWRK